MRSIFALGARPARPGIDQLLSSSGRGGRAPAAGRQAEWVGDAIARSPLIFVVGGS